MRAVFRAIVVAGGVFAGAGCGRVSAKSSDAGGDIGSGQADAGQ